MIGSINPGSGQLYIVDAFIVVVFGGVASLLGTGASAFLIAQSQSTLEYLMTGSMARVSIQRRESAGSITSSSSKRAAMFSALPCS